MKSISSVGIAVISGSLLICYFCIFVSCQETQETCEANGCTWVDEQSQCNCPEEKPQNAFLVRNQRTKSSDRCEHTLCKSEGDPHITTFNGHYYHIYRPGVYTLASLRDRKLWIQVQHDSCGSVSCNCGVLAREGNSIIGITLCDGGSTPLVKYHLAIDAHSGSIRKISGGWKISLLSGIEIEVITWENGKYMHVYVKGLKSERDRYKGLCAAKSTDVPQNSKCSDLTCDQYRVNDSDSFFRIPQGNRPNCSKKEINSQCGCFGDYPNCAEPGDITIKAINDYKCKPNVQVVDTRLNMGYRFFGHVRSLTPKPVTGVEDGRSRCIDALRLSPTYELCSNMVDFSTTVESCALDENILKEDGPAKSIATEFETVCLDKIRLSIEADANSQELKDLLAKVEKLVCPSQCSQNGKCVDSKCQCNAGFTGTDCSLRIGQASVVKK